MKMSNEDAAIQRAIDKTPADQFPRTYWGIRAMLASEGLVISTRRKTVSNDGLGVTINPRRQNNP